VWLAIFYEVSPLSVRRYRADRLLRREFEAMRGRVVASVRARLRAAGVVLDPADLEACYSQAWHGLHTTMLAGDAEVANPEGWLALVTYRRAIDEHRSRVRTCAYAAAPTGHDGAGEGDTALDPSAGERDLAGELDDRARLRQLMEGLRGRLSPRERQAAALCYLQGCSRADAAASMGISQARMRKLMDGSRPGSPGVASKVGELLDTIRAGSYCAEQSSLMRGFAFGILDPDGERYALAMAHQRECPACRAHVLSLRGLAAVLPPLPLPLALGAGMAAGAGAGTGASMGTGVGATGAAGGAAGGGWLLAGGGVGAKLAVGCLVAVGVGAGCVALSIAPIAPHPAHRRHAVHVAGPRGGYEALSAAPAVVLPVSAGVTPSTRGGASTPASTGASPTLTPAARASREFGLEQPAHHVLAPQTSISHTTARVASAASGESAESTAASTASSAGGPSGGGGTSSGHESGGPSSATREFGLG
jgi:DNA-directed RNA polymerase specialized sigma24 family protein